MHSYGTHFYITSTNTQDFWSGTTSNDLAQTSRMNIPSILSQCSKSLTPQRVSNREREDDLSLDPTKQLNFYDVSSDTTHTSQHCDGRDRRVGIP